MEKSTYIIKYGLPDNKQKKQYSDVRETMNAIYVIIRYYRQRIAVEDHDALIKQK